MCTFLNFSSHQHNPRVLFKTIDLLLNPAHNQCPVKSDADCYLFLSYFTETALLRVTSDLLMAADEGMCSILVLLDLSAAFDMIDHSILLERLRHWVGISGTAFNWFYSYLTNRKYYVSAKNWVFAFSTIKYGVPQGSVLGPVLFSIYIYIAAPWSHYSET